jgi:phosphosulfolactate synthase
LSYFLSEISGVAEKNDSRAYGKTMVLDRFLTGTPESVAMLHNFVDCVKIGWGLPYVLEERALLARIQSFREAGVSVSSGGTLLEIAFSKGRHRKALDGIRRAGFDTVELSEGVVEMPQHVKREIAEFARSHGLKLHSEVGRKNPRNQLSLEETVDRISQMIDLGGDLVIIEGRETGRSVEIYDDSGEIKWDWVERIRESCPEEKLMFEAPQEKQQTELLLKLGSKVNLGNVSAESIGALATQRLGLRGDTLGAFVGNTLAGGSPAALFVYHVLQTHGSMDQSRIISVTGLQRRTVQKAIGYLEDQGLVRRAPDHRDLRRHIYSVERMSAASR